VADELHLAAGARRLRDDKSAAAPAVLGRPHAFRQIESISGRPVLDLCTAHLSR
jgi:hypothetical protein